MSAAEDTAAGQAPFSPRAMLALVLFGSAVFIALLWMIGSGMAGGSTNDGGAHAGGKGLAGYAALADLLERRGMQVRRSMSEGALDDTSLLVLTPPQFADGKALNEIVEKRRGVGPTLIITPKWIGAAPPEGTPGAKDGWVVLAGTDTPRWQGFLDDVSVTISPMSVKGGTARWAGAGEQGELPDPGNVLSGSGARLVPLVVGAQDGRILAAYVDDDGIYSDLEAMAVREPASLGDNGSIYPIVIVFEPDLLNNYGMADAANARLAERLIRAAAEDSDGTIVFDLTLNGHSRSANLLTLAFTPPFLAATICLLLAALAVGWRAFLRFGPPVRGTRAIAFGKGALVSNAAGLIRRAGRLHLVAGPYAAAVRDRLARKLALPRLPDVQATDAAIDRALAGRRPDAEPFSHIAARLAAARRPHDILKAAQDLHSLERTLKR
jgi:hypothetical protein